MYFAYKATCLQGKSGYKAVLGLVPWGCFIIRTYCISTCSVTNRAENQNIW